MVSKATKGLISLLLVAGLSACWAFEVRSCGAERQACLDRCGQSKVDFDCDDGGDGNARAFSCACASGEWSEELFRPVVTGVEPGDDRANNKDAPLADSMGSADLAYCDAERLKCIDLCANSMDLANSTGTGNMTRTGAEAPRLFPLFQCEEGSADDGMSRAFASSCSCNGTADAAVTITPTGERAVDTAAPQAPCDLRRIECTQSCPEGYVPEFQCESDGDEARGSFSIASACSCVEEGVEGSGNGEDVGGKSTLAAESAAYESGYKAGAKFVTGYLLSTLALVQAVTDGEN